MTPSKSGSRTEERGRGISNAGRPFRSPRTVGLLPFSIRRSPPWLRPAPNGAYAAGRSQSPCRWGDPFMHAVARRPARIRWPIRFCPPGVRPTPPATAGSRVPAARSAFALRGEPPRLWLSSLGLSRSAPPSVGRLSTPLRGRSARCRWPDPWPRRPSRLGGRSRHARKPHRCRSMGAGEKRWSRPPRRGLQPRPLRAPMTAAGPCLAPRLAW